MVKFSTERSCPKEGLPSPHVPWCPFMELTVNLNIQWQFMFSVVIFLAHHMPWQWRLMHLLCFPLTQHGKQWWIVFPVRGVHIYCDHFGTIFLSTYFTSFIGCWLAYFHFLFWVYTASMRFTIDPYPYFSGDLALISIEHSRSWVYT